MRRVDPAAVDRAVAMVSAGASLREASQATGVSHTTISGRCKARGVNLAGRRPGAPAVEAALEVLAPSPAALLPGPAVLLGPVSPDVASPEQVETILRCVGKGMTLRMSSMRAGVPLATVDLWEHKAAAGEEPWSSWLLTVAARAAQGVEGIHDTLLACQPGWQALAWLLERCFSETYGKRLQVVQERPQVLADVPDDTLLAVVEAWRRGRVDKGGDGG